MLGVLVVADRRAVTRQLEEMRALAQVNEKELAEANNNMRFLVLRVEDLEGDVKTLAEYMDTHTHPIAPGSTQTQPPRKGKSVLKRVIDRLKGQ